MRSHWCRSPHSFLVYVAVCACGLACLCLTGCPPEAVGSLTVTLLPQEAIDAGAQWRVGSGDWQASGAIVTGLTPGDYAVTFKDVAGWSTPSSVTASVADGQTAMVEATYVEAVVVGSLTVALLPQGAVDAGAQWRVGSGDWQTSGATVTGLTPGDYTVVFQDVDGWSKPSAATASVAGEQTTLIEATYVQILGTSHAGRFTTYEGSKTCNVCHLDKAQEAHASVHYQWDGSATYAENITSGGKLGSINDFCSYPDINWIGLMTNVDGVSVSGGCAQCHVGMGETPAATATTAQLENIDCLVCHSDRYKRKVASVAGGFGFVPDTDRMEVSLLEAITDIHIPTSSACINCHAYAGGGMNNKRGDIEEGHRNASVALDVHMAAAKSGGAGLTCLDCHQSSAHRIAGRGTDLRPTDLDVEVTCTKCHAARPHVEAALNRHVDRVSCQACHVPRFAKFASTDMVRDFSQTPDLLEHSRLYEPHIERGLNVIPEYRFSNGMSRFYVFGEPAVAGDSGRVLMAGPVGGVTDSGAQIVPLKHHRAVQPYDVDTGALIPLKMGVLFQTGDGDEAIRQGAAAVGWPLASGYDFVATERFMGLYHEVLPAGQALSCNDCHEGGERLDFAALDYTPKTTRAGKPLCTSCHKDESGEWAGDFFNRVHGKHVDDEKYDCSECHAFSAAKGKA